MEYIKIILIIAVTIYLCVLLKKWGWKEDEKAKTKKLMKDELARATLERLRLDNEMLAVMKTLLREAAKTKAQQGE